MIVFSSQEDEYLKIDLKFERFPMQAKEEGYRILLINTETNE